MMEPRGILWENLHLTKISRAIRLGLQVLLIVTILISSTIFVFMLASMEITLKNNIYKGLEKHEVLQMNDTMAILTFCINLSPEEFYK